MKRVAWLLYGSMEERTGGTIYDRIVVEGLVARGFEIDVVDPRQPRNARLRRLLAAQVVVGDELCFREIADVFPRLPGRTRVLLVHHLSAWEEERREAERRRARVREAQALRASDAIVTTSHATRARLEREGVRRPIDVVLPGADRLPRVEATRRDRETTRFLFVGAVTARKRVRELVRALPRSAELRVVGSVSREPRYAETVRAESEGRSISWLGEIDEPALARELSSADALVMPSSLEGYGIAATEALRAGVPVIAARTPGLEEALAPCPNAILFAPARTDSNGLERALQDFSTDPALRARMREAAAVAALPTWAQAVERFATRLQSAMDRPRT